MHISGGSPKPTLCCLQLPKLLNRISPFYVIYTKNNTKNNTVLEGKVGKLKEAISPVQLNVACLICATTLHATKLDDLSIVLDKIIYELLVYRRRLKRGIGRIFLLNTFGKEALFPFL